MNTDDKMLQHIQIAARYQEYKIVLDHLSSCETNGMNVDKLVNIIQHEKNWSRETIMAIIEDLVHLGWLEESRTIKIVIPFKN